MSDVSVPPTAPGLLVVDDDAILLPLLRTFFNLQGFLVWACSSGAEAVSVYRQNQRGIDIVLLDVRMPGLDGPQTLAELRSINPTVRACFMSGHLGDYTPEQLHAMGAVRLFDKPFQLAALADELRRIVAGTARRSA